MKTIFTLIALSILALTLTGCGQQKNIGSDGQLNNIEMQRVHFEGHDYLLYASGGHNTRIGGITHDPDCKCLKDSVK